MKPYETWMLAADFIENNPDRYNFAACVVPDEITEGCMIGWLGHFAGFKAGDSISNVWRGLGFTAQELYSTLPFDPTAPTDPAAVMRVFAEQFK